MFCPHVDCSLCYLLKLPSPNMDLFYFDFLCSWQRWRSNRRRCIAGLNATWHLKGGSVELSFFFSLWRKTDNWVWHFQTWAFYCIDPTSTLTVDVSQIRLCTKSKVLMTSFSARRCIFNINLGRVANKVEKPWVLTSYKHNADIQSPVTS